MINKKSSSNEWECKSELKHDIEKKNPTFHKELKNALCKRIKIVEYAGFKFDIQWRYKIGNNDELDSIYSTIVMLK